MEMKITGKNIEVAPAVRDYINNKLGKMDRYLSNILYFEVVATEQQAHAPDQRFAIQVTLDNNGTLLRGEERGQDLYTATDKVVEKMSRQIEHYKSKLPNARHRRSPSIRTTTSEVVSPNETEAPETDVRIVKNKKFEVKPMSIEEAVDQMELLGHDFFMFFNPDTNIINLVYRRKDGNYGLIEPSIK